MRKIIIVAILFLYCNICLMPLPLYATHQSIKTNEEIGKSQDLYKITQKDLQDAFDKLQSPEVFGGPTTVPVDQMIDKTAEPGETVYTMNSQIFQVSPDGTDGSWSTSITVPSNGIFWIRGNNVGNADLGGTVSGTENIEVTEAIPITLESFDVMKKDGHPVLSWATASETNNDYFVIERSFDGRDFEAIDTIKSQAENGTSRARLEYSYTDTSEDLSGTVYYRLKQVDKDGQSETFDAKTVVIENPDLAPTLSPNPASNGQVTLEIFNKNQDAYRIVNMHGQEVAHGSLSLGQNTIQLSSLPAGQYLVQVKGSNKALKLIVQ